jgi:hypothetical protein
MNRPLTSGRYMMEDEEELESLVTRSLPRIDEDEDEMADYEISQSSKSTYSMAGKYLLFLTLVALIVGSSFVILVGDMYRFSSLFTTSLGVVNPNFQCPAVSEVASENSNEAFTDRKNYLDQEDAQFTLENADYFLKTFRDHKFDGWNENYNENKEKLRDTKKEFFVPHIQPGDHIYESACGLGLNLYTTLEIMQEEANITDITVHGNEYLAPNAEKANNILNFLMREEHATPPNHVGSICQGDSTNLSFVPSNTYDFVFTGWITPLFDPLEIGKNFSTNLDIMREMCRSVTGWKKEDDSWQDKLLMELAQERQDNWYLGWVNEMIRIAKPGAPVIVEEVALPLCDGGSFDYGGVTRDLWTHKGPSIYGWDIDPKSVKMRTNRRYGDNRYHVFMRKNGPGRH